MCDVIIDMDVMTEIGVCVNAADKVTQWEENTAPLCPRGALGEKSMLNTVHSLSVEAGILKDAEARQNAQWKLTVTKLTWMTV